MARKAKVSKAKAKVKKAARKVARRPAAAPRRIKKIPDGYHSLTPSFFVHDGQAALEFYKKAFGAQVTSMMPGPGGKVMHAELRIGDSMMMMGDEMPEMGNKSPRTLGGTAGGILIYTEDVDALFARAVAAGATVLMPVTHQFWGDRYGIVADPFGHRWQMATHVEDVSLEEMQRRMEALPPPTPPTDQTP